MQPGILDMLLRKVAEAKAMQGSPDMSNPEGGQGTMMSPMMNGTQAKQKPDMTGSVDHEMADHAMKSAGAYKKFLESQKSLEDARRKKAALLAQAPVASKPKNMTDSQALIPLGVNLLARLAGARAKYVDPAVQSYYQGVQKSNIEDAQRQDQVNMNQFNSQMAMSDAEIQNMTDQTRFAGSDYTDQRNFEQDMEKQKLIESGKINLAQIKNQETIAKIDAQNNRDIDFLINKSAEEVAAGRKTEAEHFIYASTLKTGDPFRPELSKKKIGTEELKQDAIRLSNEFANLTMNDRVDSVALKNLAVQAKTKLDTALAASVSDDDKRGWAQLEALIQYREKVLAFGREKLDAGTLKSLEDAADEAESLFQKEIMDASGKVKAIDAYISKNIDDTGAPLTEEKKRVYGIEKSLAQQKVDGLKELKRQRIIGRGVKGTAFAGIKGSLSSGKSAKAKPTRGRPSPMPGYVPVDPTSSGYSRIKTQNNNPFL